MSKVDSATFPRLARYLDQLPVGLDSYPECLARGAVARSRLDGRPIRDLTEGALPPALLRYFREPPANTSWIPHVHMLSIALAIADWYRMSDEQYFQWAYQSNKQMLTGVIYRLLMSISSPALLLSLASARWSALHRGTILEVEDNADRKATVVLRFPPRLFDGFFVRSYGHIFKAVLELSNAKAVEWEVVEVTITTGRLHCRWS